MTTFSRTISLIVLSMTCLYSTVSANILEECKEMYPASEYSKSDRANYIDECVTIYEDEADELIVTESSDEVLDDSEEYEASQLDMEEIEPISAE